VRRVARAQRAAGPQRLALFHGRRRPIDRNYRGMFPISDAEIAAVVTELRRRQRFLASLGIAYVVTIVPEKYTIYPEHLPVWVAKGDAPTPLERLMVAIFGLRQCALCRLARPACGCEGPRARLLHD